MKYMATILILLAYGLTSAAYACDEKCLKEKAEASKNISFPSYLSWEFCDDTRMEFMTSTMKSLDKYRTQHIDTRYKGGIRNIKSFINQRKAWLVECDTYINLTGKGRIFKDDKTTESIFGYMDDVTKELDDLIAGVTYSSDLGQDSSPVINERFDKLLTAVRNHRDVMLMRGVYVTR